jgi:hypothetical protein
MPSDEEIKQQLRDRYAKDGGPVFAYGQVVGMNRISGQHSIVQHRGLSLWDLYFGIAVLRVCGGWAFTEGRENPTGSGAHTLTPVLPDDATLEQAAELADRMIAVRVARHPTQVDEV